LYRQKGQVSTLSFHDFEHAGWERAAAHYGDAFGALTIQSAQALLDAVGAAGGTRLLDVASGPGFIAAAAADRGAIVFAIDFASAMVEAARARYPALDVREGDAQALPFEQSSFDAVVMNFGMLHLEQPHLAVAEARRVLRPGGRYAFTVWAAPEKAVGFGMTLRAIESFGNADVHLPQGPPFFRFSDPDETRRTLEAAGFSHIDVQPLPLTWRLPSADALFAAMSRGGVRTAAVLRAQTPAALDAIRAAVRREVESYKWSDGYVVPMPAVLASGTRD
jgi:ubiquinone/menaquinone biosynthesis C-methylase UbiE